MSAGVADGFAWTSCATIPVICGQAMDVPLITLYVPRSSAPGPLCGSRPVEQIGRDSRHAEMMFSPGAEMSGQGCVRLRAPREEESDTVPSRVPVDWSLYEAADSTPGVGSLPGGLDTLAGP